MTQPNLLGELIPLKALSLGDRRELYALFSRHYENVGWPLFESDLLEKDYVIVLREADTGRIQGFSTQKILEQRVDGQDIRAIFSGDTLIDPAYWGSQELVRAWCTFAGRIHAEEPDKRLFWLLICKGYRTYMYLPVFFRRYLPGHDQPTAGFEQAVLQSLAAMKFPVSFRPERGTLEFDSPHGNLNAELSQVPGGRGTDPRVQFFLSRNPNYALGTELVCLTEISESNMKSMAKRMYLEGRRLGGIRPRPLLA